MRDLFHNLKVTDCNNAANQTADENGTSVDMVGYDSVVFVASIGASADGLSTGSVAIELEIEESDDDSTFTDVASGDMLDVESSATNDGCFFYADETDEDVTVAIGGYVGNKRYVRPVINLTGTHSSGTPISIVGIQSKASRRPVN